MLAWPYGFAQVMSSYSFIKTDDGQGKIKLISIFKT